MTNLFLLHGVTVCIYMNTYFLIFHNVLLSPVNLHSKHSCVYMWSVSEKMRYLLLFVQLVKLDKIEHPMAVHIEERKEVRQRWQITWTKVFPQRVWQKTHYMSLYKDIIVWPLLSGSSRIPIFKVGSHLFCLNFPSSKWCSNKVNLLADVVPFWSSLFSTCSLIYMFLLKKFHMYTSF